MLDLCRQVYNSLLLERKATYQTTGDTITYRQQQNVSLKKWKAKFPELTGIHSQVLQNVAVRIDLAFQAFFRRVKNGDKKTASGGFSETPGYPRLKGRGVYDSITFPQAQKTGCKLIGETLQISKIGQVKCVIHRKIIGQIKTCTIRRLAGKWFACFSCEYEPTPLPKSSESVGIDVGLNQFAALATAPHVPCVRAVVGDRSLSDGTFVANPRFFRRDEKALAKAGRKQSKTKRGSILRRKANKVLSRIHERIRNRRHDFVHQTARRLVNRFGLIAVEDLNVKGMVKNHCLAKSISDAAWSMFRRVLASKAESADRQLVCVNPAYTSQDCSGCGYRPDKRKTLKDRWHFCPKCSLSLDRDTNAAFNILKTALGLQSVAGMPCIEAPAFIRGE